MVSRCLQSVVYIMCLVILPGLSLAGTAIDPSQVIFHYHGEDTTSKIGVFISSIGDINADGFDDISISSYAPPGTYIFYGDNPVDTIPDLFYDSCFNFRRICDFTNDGILDIVAVKHRYAGEYYWADKILFFEGYPDSIASVPFDSLMPNTTVTTFGLFMQVGYIDGDEYPDIFVYEDGVNGRILHYYSGFPLLDREVDWEYVLPATHSLSDVDTIDYNGDGQMDVLLGIRGRSDSYPGIISIFFGPTFAGEPDVVIEPPSDQYDIWLRYFPYRVRNIGDFNGDGWDDIGDVFVGASGGV